MKLKKGDEVILLAGKDKGKKAKIDKLFPKKKVILLPGLNLYKRHLKKRDEKNPGGIVEFSRPVRMDKVALICLKCGKKTRVGFLKKDGRKIRICKKCNSAI